MYEYPLWLLIFVMIPLAVLWLWKFRVLVKYAKIFEMVVIGSLIFAVPWDIIAVKTNIWYFKKPHIFGIWFLGLPIEEYLFIIFVSLLFSTFAVLLWEKWGVRQ